ncbi:hypothetical protein ZWY2020_034572 [Hordeum vulgare]|nr:hypothetical protein ZWY2020_034572 [Hordeum vulgare]
MVGDEHELVEAVGVKSFSHCGPWLHANFLARRKGASSCDAVVPKYLFAELRIDADGLSCVSCFKMDSDVECARQRLSIPLVVCTLVPGRNDVFSLLPQVQDSASRLKWFEGHLRAAMIYNFEN